MQPTVAKRGSMADGTRLSVATLLEPDAEVLRQLVRDLQLIAGELSGGKLPDLASHLVAAIDALPESLGPLVWWTARGLVADAVIHLLTRGSFVVSELQLRQGIAAAVSPSELASLLGHALGASRSAPGKARALEARVERAVDYIRANCSRPSLSLDEVSRDLRLSRWHLGRLLVRHAGCSYREVLRRARMIQAERLLREPTLSIKEVSAQLGFPHPGELDRQFKRSFGVTPTQWRAGLRRPSQRRYPRCRARTANHSHKLIRP